MSSGKSASLVMAGHSSSSINVQPNQVTDLSSPFWARNRSLSLATVVGLGDCSAGVSTESLTRTRVLWFLVLVVSWDVWGSDAVGVTAREVAGGTARGVVEVASGAGGECSGFSGAFFFFKALRRTRPGIASGVDTLAEAGEEEASNAACSGRDRKLTMEVCFMGLATGVFDLRNMLPRVKVEPNHRLENGVAAVLVPFFCTLKRAPGLVWAT